MAPSAGPSSEARPPRATPAISMIEAAASTLVGEMMPAIGTNIAPPMLAITAATTNATSLMLAGS